MGYAVLGAIWLLFAQELAVRLFASEIGRGHARDLFSWLFVAASALGLLWLLRAATRPLRQSQRALADTIESMVDAVLVVDGEGRILEANRAAVELLAVRDAAELLVHVEDFT
ncbi:MAG TPA: PAS domain-containing sensor histidine kinase, partial [Myxococcales bacterium]|nr:PAS domain-containing sensor histidine kinase [Myxococcales bacterium]